MQPATHDENVTMALSGFAMSPRHARSYVNRHSIASPLSTVPHPDVRVEPETRSVDSIVASPLPMLVLSLPDQHVRTANQAATELLGLSQAELLGRHAKDLVQPSESADTVQALSALTAGAVDSYHARRTFVGATGPIDAWVWVRSIPRPSGGMALLLLLPAPHEVLQQATRTLMGPLAVDLASGTMDGTGKIVTLLRTNPEVLLGQRQRSMGSWYLASHVHPDDQLGLWSALKRFRADHHDVVVALRVRHSQRGWIASDCHLFATGDDDDGQPVGFVLAEGTVRQPATGRVAQLEQLLARIAADAETAVLTSHPSPAVERASTDLESLTPRQRDIVDRLLDGSRVSTIAAALYVSRSTVRNHLAGVYRALGVHSQAELIELLRPA